MIKAHEWYGTPAPTKMKKKYTSCGHLGRIFIHKNLEDAWCWDCDGPVKMVRFRRFWKRHKK